MKLPFLIRGASLGLPLLGAVLSLGTGCNKSDDAKITVYRIPKETQATNDPRLVAMNNAAPNAATNAAPAEVHWTAPSGWEEQAATGFRKGSFIVRGADGKTADVSVISFPEAAGGVLANVNRWRNQLKLAPISNESEAGTPMSVDGRDLFFVDLVSDQPISPDGSKTRILGGIFPLPGTTWFFKMMGADQVVEAQRDAFKQFLHSVRVGGGMIASTSGPAPMGGNTGTSTNAPTPPPIDAAANAPMQYTVPPNWQEKPLSPMRQASFNAAAPDGKQVDVSVVSLAGMAGGDLANVNRWRDQVKLGPIGESALQQSAEHVKANGHDFLVVDVVSSVPTGAENEKQRIIGAILDENDRSWFIKMMGEDKAVASQKTAFENFLHSLKIP